MKCGNFVFDSVHLLYYKWHIINMNLCRSYEHSPGCIKNKNMTVNPINKNYHKSLVVVYIRLLGHF